MNIIRIVVAGGFLAAVMQMSAAETGCSQRDRLTATTRNQVARASTSYKRRGDAASLLVLFGHLRLGMPRKDVERLLGQPNYSPTEGQYYYCSDLLCSHDVETSSSICGVIVDYRKPPDYTLTGYLQSCSFGPIGE